MAKCIYITGGSSGIGLALARHYATRGDDVVLLAREPGKLQEAVSSCTELCVRPGQTVAGEALDITAYANLQANVDQLFEHHGLPDLLILSAGAALNKTFLDTSREEFDRLVDVNLAGSREMARAVLPAMLARGDGHIAFISSMAGLMGVYGYSAYSASKFAVTGFTQALRQELIGTGVNVSLICPAEVNTPMIAAEAPAVLPQTRFLKNMGGTLQPGVAAKEIARGLDRNRAVIIPGFTAKLMDWSGRHFPWLINRSMEFLLRWKFH